jgi:hypothetical protein
MQARMFIETDLLRDNAPGTSTAELKEVTAESRTQTWDGREIFRGFPFEAEPI